MAALEVLEIGAGYAVGRAHGVLLLHAEQVTHVEIVAATACLVSAGPARGYLQTFPRFETPSGVSERERKAWTALAEQMKGTSRAGALVVPEGGFVGAAIRASISGVLLLARGRSPVKTFATLDAAARFLCAEGAVDDGVSAARIVEAARALAGARPRA